MKHGKSAAAFVVAGLVTVACGGSAFRSLGVGGTQNKPTDSDPSRPSDEGEGVPGYLLSTAEVTTTYDPATGRVHARAPAGAVAAETEGDAARVALYAAVMDDVAAAAFAAAQDQYCVPGASATRIAVAADGAFDGEVAASSADSLLFVSLPKADDGRLCAPVRDGGGVRAAIRRVTVDGVGARGYAVDDKTDGDWIDHYGARGYWLVGAPPKLDDAVIEVTPISANTFVWADTTTDARALVTQDGKDRIAQAWYDTPKLEFRVRVVDGTEQRVTFRFLDWEKVGRAVHIAVIDEATEAVLEERGLSYYGDGAYLGWNIRGNVRFEMTSRGGDNVAVSAVFVDRPTAIDPPPVEATSVKFAGATGAAAGALGSTIGKVGAFVAADGVATRPAGWVLEIPGAQTYTWSLSADDPRAFELDDGPGLVAYFAPPHLTFRLTPPADAGRHLVSLYFVDPVRAGGGARSQTVRLLAPSDGSRLDERAVDTAAMNDGTWLSWTVEGPLDVDIAADAGPNAILMAIAVD